MHLIKIYFLEQGVKCPKCKDNLNARMKERTTITKPSTDMCIVVKRYKKTDFSEKSKISIDVSGKI